MPDRVSIQSHGAARLPAVEILSYNIEFKDDEGFVGDRASKGAFRALIDNWRKPLRALGHDPFGDEPSSALTRKRLDLFLTSGKPEAVGIVQSAIEGFAHELALVARHFLKLEGWSDVERIVMGGGFSGSRVGELAIGRAVVILRAEKVKTDIALIRHDPNKAGLIGAAHLAPAWMFRAHDAILAVDIGGTNIRVGVVELNLKHAPDLARARVWKFELWRHGDEKLDRDDAVEGLIDMLRRLIGRAREAGLRLAPFIGIGCPGRIEPDGAINRGAQNLPGDWEGNRFNLPAALAKAIPTVGNFDTSIVMHNDAVVQGLSEVPFMRDIDKWAVFTIGTGFGNALFANRRAG